MKKLIFLFAFCIVVTNVFAQTAPEQLKKEGQEIPTLATPVSSRRHTAYW